MMMVLELLSTLPPYLPFCRTFRHRQVCMPRSVCIIRACDEAALRSLEAGLRRIDGENVRFKL
jgi:hypothetical protein